jgi:hypothetical protein
MDDPDVELGGLATSVTAVDVPALAAAVVEVVPFCCMAIDLNISKVFSGVALIEKTKPFPQWVPTFCLQ